MEPITVNFDGLNEFFTQFGPIGFIVGHSIAAMFFGIVAWRNIYAAGACYGEDCHKQKMKGNAYATRSWTSGILGLVNVIIVIFMSAQLFSRTIDKAYPEYAERQANHTITIMTPAASSELERLVSAAGGVELACNKEVGE